MNGTPPAPVQRPSFGAYIHQSPVVDLWGGTPNEPGLVEYEILDRLRLGPRNRPTANGITSRAMLQSWAQNRWPDWYTRRSQDLVNGPTGKQVMAYLWADYCTWADCEEAVE